jgi:hypothetical protein
MSKKTNSLTTVIHKPAEILINPSILAGIGPDISDFANELLARIKNAVEKPAKIFPIP